MLPDHGGMIKRILRRGAGVWESPRAPFQVPLLLIGRSIRGAALCQSTCTATAELPTMVLLGLQSVPKRTPRCIRQPQARQAMTCPSNWPGQE